MTNPNTTALYAVCRCLGVDVEEAGMSETKDGRIEPEFAKYLESRASTRCDRCRFWDRIDQGDICANDDILNEDGTAMAGECRRLPPLFDRVEFLEWSKTEGEYSARALASVYPIVLQYYWCGEFRPLSEIIDKAEGR
jgi:hypothetical protein